jgi:putative N6-adenine-specific DNA methylase
VENKIKVDSHVVSSPDTLLPSTPDTQHSSTLTPRGLERRLKRHFAKSECTFLAITTPGFEQVLKEEIQKADSAKVIECIDGGVLFSGLPELVYYSNLHLRTANRILLRIDTFTARSYPELYNKSRKIAWELYCGFSEEVSFSVSSGTSRLHHTENIENAVFDGLRETMEKMGVKVDRKKNAQIRFHIRFSDDICTISIDSSGELLYKRGIRTEIAHAPIRETTAAGLLMAAHWENYPVIADPMCGSGAFVLESASLAMNRAPGINRRFSFEQWPSFKISKWERYKASAKADESPKKNLRLIASDIDPMAIKSAVQNLSNLKSTVNLTLSQKDCFEFNISGEYGTRGLLISNLPYGKRIGVCDELQQLFKNLGNHYRTYCKGWHFGFVTADRKFPQTAKLHVKEEIRFVNGGIPVSFFMGKF